jgi:pimeloyl-ACP methyl ester carboxylesterase
MPLPEAPETVPRGTGRRHRTQRSPLRLRSRILAGITALLAALAGAATVHVASAAGANPYQRGPDPTAASIAADHGTFATAQVSVAKGNGFGGGVIYYPTDTSQGTFSAIAIAPGLGTEWSWYAWLGPRLASFGFVVIGIETNSLDDWSDARATQLLAALDWLTTSSPVRDRVDRGRLAVGGHSMGGGGALTAGLQRSSLLTAIGMAPFLPSGSLADIKMPTILFGGQSDTTVPPSMVQGYYNSIPANIERAYPEIANEGHGFPAGGGGGNSGAFARTMMVWMKVFMDQDTRYSQFLCPTLSDMTGISKYQASCPLDPPGGPSTPPTTPPTNPPTTPPTTPPSTTSAVRNTSSGRCLDVNGASQTNGTAAIIWDCNGQSNQSWTSTTSQELRVYGNKCLDVNGAGTANGTQVIIWDCNGQTNQQWQVNSDATITAVGSGRCLDVVSNGTANGTGTQIWDCTAAASQKWSRS